METSSLGTASRTTLCQLAETLGPVARLNLANAADFCDFLAVDVFFYRAVETCLHVQE